MSIVKISLTTKLKVQLYQHKEDKDVLGFVRPCAVGGCPAVFVLNEPLLKVEMTKDWQYYLIAINYNMTLENIAKILDDHLAFANETGLFDSVVPRRNYILGKDLNARELPRLDKDRTCSRSFLSGTVIGSKLRLNLFDGNKPPPMKIGKSLPQTIANIRLEDYLYNPKDNPELFLVANLVSFKEKDNTSISPFPRGAIYNWTGDNMPYTFLPHISRGIIDYDLNKLIKLDMSKPLPSRYRIYP